MAGILGVVVLARNGDRDEFFQDPYTYKASPTKLTPLGQAQEVQLGAFLRSHYLNSNSPAAIASISQDLVKENQILVRADNGAEGAVILESATALLQGLFPPTSRSNTHLANGTTIVGPFNGYQYVPIESVEPYQSIQLEGWSECPAFEGHIKRFYESQEFQNKAKEAAPFLQELAPFLYGRPNDLENAWNIFDYMNVNFVHNETYAFRLPPTYLAQAQALANFHEHGVFTDKETDGIGNVAGRTILPSILTALERIANPRDPLSFVLQEVSYKPFISLFNVTGIDSRYPDLQGIPDFASALAFELRNNEEGETFLRAKFKNGTHDAGFRPLHLFGHKEDVALNEFLYRLNLAAIGDVPQWCKTCNQYSARGCAACPPGFAAPSLPKMITGGSNGSWAPMLGNQNTPFFAIFACLLFLFFGLFKLVKTYRSRPTRLPGHDQLPSTAQYYDEPPVAAKYRL